MAKRTTLPLGLALDIRGDEEIERSFKDMGSAVRGRVRRALEDLAQEILVREKSAMRARTGETRESFDQEISEKDNRIVARIGWWRLGGPGGTGWKGIFQESGVHGPVTVRKFGRGKRGGYARKTITLKSGAKRRVKVVLDTYERNVNIAAQPFVKPAWEAVKGRAQLAIEEAIEQAKREVGLGP